MLLSLQFAKDFIYNNRFRNDFRLYTIEIENKTWPPSYVKCMSNRVTVASL